MEFGTLIAALAIVTMLLVIGFALWSKRRTEKMLDNGVPKRPSVLARETPDPNFKPDRRVTDPQGVRS